MKKTIIFTFIILSLFLTGCGNNKTKTIATTSEFQNVSTNNGFSVNSNINNYNVDYITDAIVATLDDIIIEMVIYDTSDNATKAFNSQTDSFMSLKNTTSVINKDKGKNYSKITMISNGYYMVSSRVDNTLIFSKTNVNNKDKVETIFNSLNY